MSWECRFLRETFCAKRKQECNPGSPGCVLYGRFFFPLREDDPGKAASSPDNPLPEKKSGK